MVGENILEGMKNDPQPLVEYQEPRTLGKYPGKVRRGWKRGELYELGNRNVILYFGRKFDESEGMWKKNTIAMTDETSHVESSITNRTESMTRARIDSVK